MGCTTRVSITATSARRWAIRSRSAFMRANRACGKTAWAVREPFWRFFYPMLQQTFHHQLRALDGEQFYAAINRVKPSLIRVEADELTYNLHIMLRFEIEQDLIEGRTRPEDLPEIWNQKMKEYLGIVPFQRCGRRAARRALVVRRLRLFPDVYARESLLRSIL